MQKRDMEKEEYTAVVLTIIGITSTWSATK